MSKQELPFVFSDAMHAIRTSLTILKTQSFLEEDTENELVQTVKNEVDYLNRLADDLSLLVLIANNQLQKEDESVSVLSAIEDAGGNAENRIVEGDTFFIKTDKSHLTRALGALIDNAIRYSDSQNVNINLDKEARKITITSHGIGIPKDELNEILKPFVRGSNQPPKEERKRPGLGLPVVKSLAELYGWDLTVESDGIAIVTATLIFP